MSISDEQIDKIVWCLENYGSYEFEKRVCLPLDEENKIYFNRIVVYRNEFCNGFILQKEIKIGKRMTSKTKVGVFTRGYLLGKLKNLIVE